MKKLALTSLFVTFAFKSVSACSYAAGYKPTEHITFAMQYQNLFFYGSGFIVFLIGAIYFLRKRAGLLILILAVVSFFGAIPVTIFTKLNDMCGKSNYDVFMFEFSFLVLLFLIQTLLLIKEFRQMKNYLP